MKLAFEYYSLGFQRIIFMILGAQIAFIICYLTFCDIFQRITIPALPEGYATGGQTLAGAMVVAGCAAVITTIETLLFLAAIALILGYINRYLAVLSYYDEEKFSWCKQFRQGKIPKWLMNFSIGQHAEIERHLAIVNCQIRCKDIKESIE